FPDVMRWLWKDWPQPVKAGASKNQMLREILVPGEGWRPAAEGRGTAALAASAKGEVLFNEEGGKTERIGGDGKAEPFPAATQRASGEAFGPNGRLFTVAADGRVLAYDAAGKPTVLTTG